MSTAKNFAGKTTIASAEMFTPVVSQQKPSLGFFVVELSIGTDAVPLQLMMNLGDKLAVSETLTPGNKVTLMAEKLHARLLTSPKGKTKTKCELSYKLVGFQGK